MVIKDDCYIPHQAVVLTDQNSIQEFSLKKVLYAYKDRAENAGTSSALWELEIHPSGSCGLKCKDCSYQTRLDNKFLTVYEVEKILNNNMADTMRSIFFSGGGDPLTWKYWPEFFDLIEIPEYVKIGISTNLLYFDSIRNYTTRFDFFQIHVIGYNEESFIKNAGVECFQRVDRNINDLLLGLNNNQAVVLKILVNKENYTEINSFLDYVMEKNARTVVVKFEQDFLCDRSVLSKKHTDYVRKAIMNHPIYNQYEVLIDNLNDVVYSSYSIPQKCWFAESGLYKLVDMNGNEYPCIASNNTSSLSKLDRSISDCSNRMKEGKCPLHACRHYRFSQYIEKHIGDSVSEVEAPILL